ncbi:thermonuclease family protein [Paramicrobacterium sp. CJ85]|uniref:thermonuclease family protein n=1 Tax=Paramicrobacterium sp. CJ85 TaxID=3445355 RepID=UPI003F6342EB
MITRAAAMLIVLCGLLAGCAFEAPVQSAPSAGVPEGAEAMTVVHVHDGDTLFLQPEGTSGRDEQIKVRLLGIDTPELDPEECFGPEARDELRGILPDGSTVWTLPDEEPLDQYGRSLLYLWTDDGEFVNESLVADGYATVLVYEPNTRYEPQLREAEADAEAATRGLWQSCR